ncbi:hypothetical protein [Methylorubrum salsuginis]|uniref:Uncharacterized protein n=1 Tax=Methylorubrum salsuginis TaxID=414703 RepID=A0A1I4CH58_9HYPH|nr:hypothetical protein [Methylorubrum salsuginis]SFK80554.1 hypothetical protein SAMN04488125_104216 [Methylorubrum salsuginis]
MQGEQEGRGGAELDGSLFRRFLPEIDHRTTGEILSHPDFARMRPVYIAATTAQYEITALPGQWQSTAGRVAALGAIICNDAVFDPADRATWPTLARFKQSVAVFGLTSPRQNDEIVARLVTTGHLTLERPPEDGRVRLLRPRESLLAWDREVIASYYGVLRQLYPETGYGPALARDPAFQRAQRGVATTMFPVIGGFLAANTDLLPFLSMNNGVHVLLMLAEASAADPTAPVRESALAGLKPRFGFSRSHVRNVLIAAEAHGLVVRRGPVGLGLTPRGSAALDRFIADTLASHDMTYRMARRAMETPPLRPCG